MNSLKVLDVTLRDGGCVNQFNFGEEYMNKILSALEKSGVDIIELGYIDEKNGSESGRTQYCNEQVITKNFLKHKVPGITYVAMMDYGKFNPDNLLPHTTDSIDGIRLAFHKKDRQNIIEAGKKILSKGYQFFIQPMTTMRYSDKELIEFIECVNKELPEASGFYIVDSFGEMRMNDMNRILNLVDHNLLPSMTLGFHSHNNLQLSYSNAVTLLQFPTNRNLILDCSVMGMGKGAGNLNTELFLEHLNLYYGKDYKIQPLLEVIDTVINVIHDEIYWGYSVEYYLSSINHCTPSYAGHFYQKHMLPIDQVAELLSMIKEEKKISFDKEYAEELYLEYNANKAYDDTSTVEMIKKLCDGKEVVVIAPGKSLSENKDKIEMELSKENVVSISLNCFDVLKTDYVFITRAEMYQACAKQGKEMIVSSNVSKEENAHIHVADYKKWITVDGGTQDSSGVMVLNLLNECNVSEIKLAGFDGFSVNVNDNYYKDTLRRPVTENQADKRNEFFKQYIQRIRENKKITFLTKSKYE